VLADECMAKAATKYDEALRIMRGSDPDRKRVFALLLAASSDGDHRATSAIATWYYYGQYVRKNFRKAVQFARRAALSGRAEDLHHLAICYERGDGVKTDENRAFALYASAASLGDKKAMYEVGRMLFYGIGTARDRSLAKFWYARSGIARHNR
jgi:TPR repeat protein